jgi:hypothetical protein
MSIPLLRKLLMKEAVKDTAGSSGIMSINKNIAAKVEQQLQKYVNDAMQQGVDLDTLSPEQLKMIVQMNKPKPPRVISADSPEGRGITEALFGKRGEIVDFPQKRSFKQEVDDMIKDGTITKGPRGMKKSKKVQDREMFQDANKRLKTDVDKIIADIKAMDPMDSMKEANSVIGRKGAYKNLTPEESKKILKDTEDHIFERDIPEEDFADGGVAGLLGERPGYRSAGFISGRTKSSKSKSSTNQGPAGGASAGGNYGGNVNPNQTYGGGGGGNNNTGGGGGGGPPGTNTNVGQNNIPTLNNINNIIEKIKQKQILASIINLDEEDLALDIDPRKKGVKGLLDLITKPKPDKPGYNFGVEDLLNPNKASIYGNYFNKNFLKDSEFKLGLKQNLKEAVEGDINPQLQLERRLGDKNITGTLNKEGNFNLGITMPFGKKPPGKVGPRNFQDRFAPDISKFNFEDMTGIPSQAPTNMQLAMITDTQKDLIDKQGKMGQLTGSFDPDATFNAAKMFDDKGSSGVFGIGATEAEPMTREEFDAYISEKGYADGGPARQNFKMGRRAFLKMLAGTGAGIAGLKSGLIGTGGKEVTKKAVTETVKSAGNYPPPYFFKLVEKIKFMGDDVTKKAATQDRQVVKRYKDYEMSEDLGTGEIVIKKRNEGSFYDQDGIISDEYIVYKPGQADELTKGKKPPPEYDEYTVRPDAEGKLRDSEDGLDSIDEILEEVGDPDSLTLKKASGGIARMLGE